MRNEFKEITRILGDEKVLHHKIENLKDLEEITQQGLPRKSLQNLASSLADNGPITDIIYKIIPESTYKSKNRRVRLSINASEKVVRIARLIAITTFILGEEKAISFLTKKHALLDDRKPYEVALTEVGSRRVEDILWKIFYGIPA